MCKYFQWTDEYVKWHLSWDNMLMYLATIPDYPEFDEDEEGKSAKSKDTKPTGSINLFDFDQRLKM